MDKSPNVGLLYSIPYYGRRRTSAKAHTRHILTYKMEQLGMRVLLQEKLYTSQQCLR